MEENKQNLPARHRRGERGVPGGAYKKRNQKKMSERILDLVLADDMMSIPDRIIDEILLPRIVDLGYDMTIAAVSMAFGREPRRGYGRSGGSSRGDRDRYEEDYSRYSDRSSSSSRRPRRPSYEYQEIEFRSYEGAQDAMDYIVWYCDKYDQCPVAVMYEKAGLSSVPTDWNYGWTDLSMLTEDDIVPGDDGGWIIEMPKIERVRVR